jgi:hypothetical protein
MSSEGSPLVLGGGFELRRKSPLERELPKQEELHEVQLRILSVARASGRQKSAQGREGVERLERLREEHEVGLQIEFHLRTEVSQEERKDAHRDHTIDLFGSVPSSDTAGH